MSSLPDTDEEIAKLSSERAHQAKKLFALHLSEAAREDTIAAIGLKPDFLVHCGYCSDSDLEAIRKEEISIAITPRSNAFYGLRVDYGRLLRLGINTLLGTDNGMVSRPDLFAEMSFLYLSAKSCARMDPEKIISMATTNWHQVF
ncbi:amidohydrolase family protein, partial [mine drainage metagenome]